MRHFDSVMLVVIFLSSILIAIEDPVDDDAKINKVQQVPILCVSHLT